MSTLGSKIRGLLLILVLLLVSCNSATPTPTSEMEWEDHVGDVDVVVTVMWESWCTFCKAELSELDSRYTTEDRIAIVGLNLGESQEVIDEKVEEYHLTKVIMVQSNARRGSIPVTRLYIRQDDTWVQVDIGGSSLLMGWGEGLDQRLFDALDSLLS
jgi:thiol-disulfide isomerase/thioredoxin